MELVLRGGLLAPVEFWELSPEKKAEICNGCGAKAAAVDFVPDGLLGANFTPACDIHDFMYWLGVDKREADRVFLHNLIVCCGVDCKSEWRYAGRVEFAIGYFKAVSAFGDAAFGQK